MPAVGFRFRAHAGQRTLGALRAQLRLACEIHNALRRADMDFHRGNGRCPTLTELRGLALDLRKRNEGYRQLHPRWRRGIADRFHGARRRFLEGPARECDERGFVREDLTPALEDPVARPAAGGSIAITTRPSTF